MLYKWDKQYGLTDADGHQVLQIVGGTNKFRNMAGKLLAEELNKIERSKELARKRAGGLGK